MSNFFPNQYAAVHPLDKFHVINTTTGKVVQSNSSEKAAQHAVNVLNDHNERNGHEARFEVKRL